ncbi:MAG: ATP-binding cassette domain-containing protein [Marinifilaceae bacterium]|nr:ATP-binding cassette domain-containing protein [Marinifilaceae bacterium]
MEMPIPQLIDFITAIENPLAKDIRKEVLKRLNALKEIGLGYLSLSRSTDTLSGGEAQRIKIAKYINSALTDMMYVLDEPSVGLHAKDISRLKKSLLKLRDHGNTIMIVEHHREIIEMADYVVDMGPLAGDAGGEVMYAGPFNGLKESDTITGEMLRTTYRFKESFRKPKKFIKLENATLHNLKGFDVDLPIGVITVIAGVSGSGKSSLMEHFIRSYDKPIISIRQKDIGINVRSTPATYLDIADPIRKLFAQANKSNMALFSFNSKGGCPACGGKGVIVSEMAFMESIETVCDVCHGDRYNHNVLSYLYKGKNIAQVMKMTVDEACNFFSDAPFLPKLQAMAEVGLGYLHLNQSISTLSGGELQRVKLSSQLNEKGAIFVIDEPTNGLHINDVNKLLTLFNKMVDNGNSLFLIEHSEEIIKSADYIIELGPGAGMDGGDLLFAGTPAEMLKSERSITKNYIN